MPIAVEAPPPVEPLPMLLGIAEQATPIGRIRTAMLSATGDELIMAAVGATVGHYRVTAIGADAVELQDISTGVMRRIALQ
jgi:hypothetical protein